MHKTKVCHITTLHSAWDDRIFYKECSTLAANGYDVSLIACNPGNDQRNGVSVIGLPVYKSRFFRFIFGFFSALYHSFRQRAVIYHFHDPELIPVGLILSLFGKKVIFDMHELVSAQIESKEWLSSFQRKWMRGLYGVMEGAGVRFFNAVILVGDGYLEYIRKQYPARLNKFFRLRNYSILRAINPVIVRKSGMIEAKQLIYVGGLSRIRGIREIIMAMEFVRPDYRLVLLGSFEDPDYQHQCEILPQWSRVDYEGFHPPDYVYDRIIDSKAGLALLHPYENYLTSLPVKAFEYMALGKPMVMSDFPYWQKIFGACALFVDPFNPQQIADAINHLITHPDLSATMGAAGRRLVETQFSWESEEPRLLYLYEKIIRNENFRDQ